MHLATARPRRTPALVVAVVLGLLAGLLPTAVPAAHADSGLEAEFVALINRERAAEGRSALKVAGDLTSVARKHSRVMADANDLHHNPNLSSDVSGWRKVGENVGRGPSVGSIHNAFMASSGHKRNILDPDWVEVGVGVEVRDGRIWVTEVFRVPQTTSSSSSGESGSSSTSSGSSGSSSGSGSSGSSEPSSPSGSSRSSGSSGPSASPDTSGGGSSTGAPAEEPAADEAAEPEPHEVVDQPLALDRLTVTLARLEVTDERVTLEDLLTE